MAKSPKNKKKQRSRSTLPQMNAPMQRTPSGAVHHATRAVANAVNAGVRQIISSGSKAMRRGKNQGSNATLQQGNASAIATTVSVNVPDSNLRTNTTLEYGAVDPNASLLSELGLQTPCFGMDTSQSSPIAGQMVTPTQGTTPSGCSPSTPPRLDTPGISGVTEVATDLLDIQEVMTTTSNTNVVGTLIDAPSTMKCTVS